MDGQRNVLKGISVNQLILGQANKHTKDTIGTSLLPNPASGGTYPFHFYFSSLLYSVLLNKY
jgi:hypothetical protein